MEPSLEDRSRNTLTPLNGTILVGYCSQSNFNTVIEMAHRSSITPAIYFSVSVLEAEKKNKTLKMPFHPYSKVCLIHIRFYATEHKNCRLDTFQYDYICYRVVKTTRKYSKIKAMSKKKMLVPSIDTRRHMAYHFRGLLCLYLLITMASSENVSSMRFLM